LSAIVLCFLTLALQGRKDILDVLKAAGYGAVALKTTDTKFGTIEKFDDALKCAALFTQRAHDIDGIIVTLPNFGDEKSIAESIKRSRLDLPVLIHAESDDKAKMLVADRRDSFCGKFSVCNNLRQADIPYTLTKSHTVKVASPEFARDLDDFASVCRIVKGLRNARFGAIGARTGPFNTVRYSEKLLQLAGITVETIDLSDVFARAEQLADNDKAVVKKLAAIKNYVPTPTVPAQSLLRMAKLGAIIDNWQKEMQLDGTAMLCWTSVQEFFGINCCGLMSMMSESHQPSACEVDVTGLLAMYILQLAAETPSAILDWNNNYGPDPNQCVLFHCSSLPRSFLADPKMSYGEIIAGVLGKERCYGAIVGQIKPGPATFCRTSTDDAAGLITAYVGEGKFTSDKLETFGGAGVIQIPNLQVLLQYICNMGFEHHIAVNMSTKADAIAEAMSTYLGWDVYRHQ